MAAKPAKRTAKKRSPAPKRAKGGRRWSASVMQRSDALDLESGVFMNGSARQVALSLSASRRAVTAASRAPSGPPAMQGGVFVCSCCG